MHTDELNLSKLPQLYDYYKTLGYNASFNSFIDVLSKLLAKHKELITVQDNTLTLVNQDINSVINYFNDLQRLEAELSIEQNDELMLAKLSLNYLQSWANSNKIKLPKSSSINSFSELYQSLTSLSNFFTLHD